MNIKEWAGKLNGREYCKELTDDEERQLKADGIIAAFGASDDLLEFRGVVNDEIGAWDGTTVRLTVTDDGEIKVFDEDENRETAEFNKMQIAKMKKVDAIWCPVDKNNEVWASWLIQVSDIPYANFDILEDGELYCRGIVFEAKCLE